MSAIWRSGPDSITLVRHGESEANVAEEQADAAGRVSLGLGMRDADVALTVKGRRQADALGRWILTAAEEWRPTRAFVSPYRRAVQTSRPTVRAVGLEPVVDERLRERDLGIFDGVTETGMDAVVADENRRRAELGKFYYRPPGGESWTDVILRVRSFLNDLREQPRSARVWVFSHRATIMAFRAVLEHLPEDDLMSIERHAPVPNGSLTRYLRRGSGYVLDTYADRRAETTPQGLAQRGAAVESTGPKEGSRRIG